ncbi:response regulator [Leptospira ilyithenensis]|uniref:Response regulator n=1 Tax=Leptospira ilyithenensis TaxID=2484901 RepID=A0A4R9LVB9_9LEPT|nr:response regulator [Leptospira ilyithenensis]TGN14530.1 response regulator [Leptospira ilyithenensis]
MIAVREDKKINIISIIDDDIVYQVLASKIIRSTELVSEIMQFYDGEEALDFFEENAENSSAWPEIIFLDLNMPYMDGWQFLKEFANRGFHGKGLSTIYIVSSSNSDIDKQKAKEFSEVTGYYIKPVLKEDYLKIFSEHLASY